MKLLDSVIYGRYLNVHKNVRKSVSNLIFVNEKY